jgi:undecaprenyl diphosphate synthase
MNKPETTAAAETLPPLTHIPAHIAIIMDGNGRWAKARGLNRAAGHRAGTENLRRVLSAVVELGIPILTIYAFSTENWERPRSEVRVLLGLIERVLDTETQELARNGVRIRHIGRISGLPIRVVNKIRQAETLTRYNEKLVLNVAFNYGGRAEIVDAVRAIVNEGLDPDEITESTVSAHLTTAGLPDPDLIIRTGGDQRLSNFMIWQAAYAELYVTPIFWPDFDREELYKAILAFGHRQRRFGRVESDET